MNRGRKGAGEEDVNRGRGEAKAGDTRENWKPYTCNIEADPTEADRPQLMGMRGPPLLELARRGDRNHDAHTANGQRPRVTHSASGPQTRTCTLEVSQACKAVSYFCWNRGWRYIIVLLALATSTSNGMVHAGVVPNAWNDDSTVAEGGPGSKWYKNWVMEHGTRRKTRNEGWLLGSASEGRVMWQGASACHM